MGALFSLNHVGAQVVAMTATFILCLTLGAERQAQDEGRRHGDDLGPHVIQAEQRAHIVPLPCDGDTRTTGPAPILREVPAGRVLGDLSPSRREPTPRNVPSPPFSRS